MSESSHLALSSACVLLVPSILDVELLLIVHVWKAGERGQSQEGVEMVAGVWQLLWLCTALLKCSNFLLKSFNVSFGSPLDCPLLLLNHQNEH